MRTRERPWVILRRVGEIGVGAEAEGGIFFGRDGVRKWEGERERSWRDCNGVVS
jgi:hypothetical protein